MEIEDLDIFLTCPSMHVSLLFQNIRWDWKELGMKGLLTFWSSDSPILCLLRTPWMLVASISRSLYGSPTCSSFVACQDLNFNTYLQIFVLRFVWRGCDDFGLNFADSIISNGSNLGRFASIGNWLQSFWFSCRLNNESEPPLRLPFFVVLII